VNAPQPGPREIVNGMSEVVLPALGPDAPEAARASAREVAQLLGFSGLAAALAQLERHPGAARPREVEHLAERIARVVEQAREQGVLAPLHDADRELRAIADQLEVTHWSTPQSTPAPVVPTLEVGETLAELPLEASPETLHSRLTMSVASALRAAVDWLGGDESPRISASIHDSALTLTVRVSHEGGLGPAGAVLAAVEGSLGREPDGRWTLRVPRCTERPSFLLVRQGRFGFALPWHAVARLRMFAPHELDRLVEPRLDPLAALSPTTSERPAAMLALGLVRGWFIADRLVWRIAAQSEESEVASPFSGATRVVEVEGGERYWVLDPAWLLRGIVPPEVAPPTSRPRASVSAAPAPEIASEAPAAAAPERHVAPEIAVPETAVAPANISLADAAARALAALRSEREAAERAAAEHAAATSVTPTVELEPEPAPDVDALVDEAFSFEIDGAQTAEAAPELAEPDPAEAVMFGEPAPFMDADPAPEHAPIPALRRALVADDSLVARIFLTRLLEQRGWTVETAPDSAGLWAALHEGDWTLVCADYSLPDASGRAHLERLVAHLSRRALPCRLIVLTRDEEEEHVAAQAGAALAMRKPFDPGQLDQMLEAPPAEGELE
jgi:two-component system chemotaxis response regulator CheY